MKMTTMKKIYWTKLLVYCFYLALLCDASAFAILMLPKSVVLDNPTGNAWANHAVEYFLWAGMIFQTMLIVLYIVDAVTIKAYPLCGIKKGITIIVTCWLLFKVFAIVAIAVAEYQDQKFQKTVFDGIGGWVYNPEQGIFGINVKGIDLQKFSCDNSLTVNAPNYYMYHGRFKL